MTSSYRRIVGKKNTILGTIYFFYFSNRFYTQTRTYFTCADVSVIKLYSRRHVSSWMYFSMSGPGTKRGRLTEIFISERNVRVRSADITQAYRLVLLATKNYSPAKLSVCASQSVFSEALIIIRFILVSKSEYVAALVVYFRKKLAGGGLLQIVRTWRSLRMLGVPWVVYDLSLTTGSHSEFFKPTRAFYFCSSF